MKTYFKKFNARKDRCKYCSSILPELKHDRYQKLSFCDEWCYEMENPPELKHLCEMCGEVVIPFRRPDGTFYTVYPKKCPDCKVALNSRGRYLLN